MEHRCFLQHNCGLVVFLSRTNTLYVFNHPSDKIMHRTCHQPPQRRREESSREGALRICVVQHGQSCLCKTLPRGRSKQATSGSSRPVGPSIKACCAHGNVPFVSQFRMYTLATELEYYGTLAYYSNRPCV